MNVIWEPDDIVVGRKVGTKGCGEKWAIGYLASAADNARFVMISTVDFMVDNPKTKTELAQSLTNGGYLPEELL